MGQRDKLAILVGGGPAPGINAVIGAATIRACLEGVEVLGIEDGFEWIVQGITDHARPLTIENTSRIHFRGGSYIGIARANPTTSPERLETGSSHPFGARVSITTEDGVHERLHADPSGEPSSFPDAQAMQQKFLTLARPVLNGRADQLADAILSLERYDRVETATHLGRQ